MKDFNALLKNRPAADTPRDPSHFAHLVRQTAEMLKRPYIQVAKLVEDWPQHKIERRLKEAKASDNPQKYWWGKRKWEMGEIKSNKQKDV